MKRVKRLQKSLSIKPAAFRRLCVETIKLHIARIMCHRPAAFRRLCVETMIEKRSWVYHKHQPPSGGCVLKRAKPSTS